MLIAVCSCKAQFTSDNAESMTYHGLRIVRVGNRMEIVPIAGHTWTFVPDVKLTQEMKRG